MLTQYSSACMSRRLFFLLASVSCFSYLASDAHAEFGATDSLVLQQLLMSQQSTADRVQTLHLDNVDLQTFLEDQFTPSGDFEGYTFSEALLEYLYNAEFGDNKLFEWLTGTGSPVVWDTAAPQFRFLGHGRAHMNPEDNVRQQSLTYFLSYVLGQNVDLPYGTAFVEWDNAFTTNSYFRGVDRTGSSVSQDQIGYGAFNVWLAEALRRGLINQTNLYSEPFVAVYGETNTTDVLIGSIDETARDQAVTNLYDETDAVISNAFSEAGIYDDPDDSFENEYSNDDDFSGLLSSFGPSNPDDVSVYPNSVIRLASRGQVAGMSGLNYAGPDIEFSLTSSGGGTIDAAIGATYRMMLVFWQWAKGFAIFWVVVHWYMRCRSLALSFGQPEPSNTSNFRI